MLSRSVAKVYASAAKDNKAPRAAGARVVPKASLHDAPKQYIETGAEAPMPTASFSLTTTPFDDYNFAPIREATVSVVLLLLYLYSTAHAVPFSRHGQSC